MLCSRSVKFAAGLTIAVAMLGCAANNRINNKETRISVDVGSKPLALAKDRFINSKVLLKVSSTINNYNHYHFSKKLRKKLSASGYKIVDDPKNADLVLKVNLLRLGANGEHNYQYNLSQDHGGDVIKDTKFYTFHDMLADVKIESCNPTKKLHKSRIAVRNDSTEVSSRSINPRLAAALSKAIVNSL